MIQFKERIDDLKHQKIKVIFDDRNAVVETNVQIFGQDRVVIGIATQVNCPIRCTRCNTNEFRRNLKTEEMDMQIDYVLHDILDITNKKYDHIEINTSGMGEPMLNWQQLERTINHYLSRRMYFNVITYGIRYRDIFSRIMNLGQRNARFGFHFSLIKLNDIDRLSGVLNKTLSYMKIREMITEGRRFNHLAHIKAKYHFLVTGHETDHDIALLCRNFKDFTLVCYGERDDSGNSQVDQEILQKFADRVKEQSKGTVDVDIIKDGDIIC